MAATPSASRRLSSNGFRIEIARPGTLQSSVTSPVGPDGRFTLKQAPVGEWQLAVTPVPPRISQVGAARRQDVRFTNFEVGSDDTSLNIVVSAHTATVEGEIDSRPSDSKRAGIVIAPVAGPYHTLARFYYGADSDDAGKFKLTGIAPGKYKIFALEKMAAGSFRNPEAVDQLGEFGDVMDLAEDMTFEAHPKSIPMDRAVKALQ